MLLQCAQCHGQLRVPDSLAGNLVRCPQCLTTFRAVGKPTDAIPVVEPVGSSSSSGVRMDPGRPDWVVSSESALHGTRPPYGTTPLPAPRQTERAQRWDGDDFEDDRSEPRPRRKRGSSGSGLAIAIALVVVAVLAAGAVGLYFLINRSIEDSDWQEFTDNASGFRVEFPGTPWKSSETEHLGAGMMITAHGFECNRAGWEFAVVYADVPNEAVRGQQAHALLADAQSGFASELSGQVQSTTSIRSPGGAYPGIQFVVSAQSPRSTVAARFFLVGSRLYMLIVARRHLSVTDTEVKRFFDSFALLDDAPDRAQPGGQPNQPGRPPGGGFPVDRGPGPQFPPGGQPRPGMPDQRPQIPQPPRPGIPDPRPQIPQPPRPGIPNPRPQIPQPPRPGGPQPFRPGRGAAAPSPMELGHSPAVAIA